MEEYPEIAVQKEAKEEEKLVEETGKKEDQAELQEDASPQAADSPENEVI